MKREFDSTSALDDCISAIVRANLGEINSSIELNPGLLTSVDERGRTPIIHAVLNAQVDSLKLLCELGAPLTEVSINGRTVTPVYIAAYYGYLDVIVALHELGADLCAPSLNGRRPATVAACMGQLDALQLLHSLGADTHCFDDGGRSPLHMAAVFGQLESIHALLLLGADLMVTDSDGNTPVHAAVMFGPDNMDRWQQDLGAGFATPGVSPRFPSDHIACLLALHAGGASISVPERNGCTPVYLAAAAGQTASIVALHELGADVSTPANAGDTPVYGAAYSGHASAIRVLHELGADINAVAVNGDNPVCAAAFNGHPDAIRALHELGGNIMSRSHNGDTAVCCAAFNGHTSAVKMLHELGADLTVPGNGRCTPLHMAAWKGAGECFRYLIDAGVDSRHLSRTHFEFPTIMAAITETREACAGFPGNDIERFELHSLVKMAASALLEPFDCSHVDCCRDRSVFESDLGSHFTADIKWIPLNEYRKLTFARRKQMLLLVQAGMRAACVGTREHDRVAVAVELIVLLFRPDVLKDVYHLRMTCMCCEAERRFPVPASVSGGAGSVSALEVHLIEQFIGGDISYYVPTSNVKHALNLHGVFQAESQMEMFS